MIHFGIACLSLSLHVLFLWLRFRFLAWMSIIRRHYLNISSITLIAFRIFNVFPITFYYLPLPPITFLKSREIWIDFPINFYFLPLPHTISILSNWGSFWVNFALLLLRCLPPPPRSRDTYIFYPPPPVNGPNGCVTSCLIYLTTLLRL